MKNVINVFCIMANETIHVDCRYVGKVYNAILVQDHFLNLDVVGLIILSSIISSIYRKTVENYKRYSYLRPRVSFCRPG